MIPKLSYREILDSFDESFQEYKCRNMSNLEALAKTFEDFEIMMNKGDLEKATILIRYGELVLMQPYVFHKSKDYIVNFLEEVDCVSLQQELSDVEYQEFVMRKKEVLYNLNNKPLTNNARAMWYYDEMIDEVNCYYNTINLKDKTADEIARDVLERFKRACRNTKSEKIGVYTTLAERLLEDDLTDSIELKHIRDMLKEFNINEVGEQLSNHEKQKLHLRIEWVLKRLIDN
ncbi:Imm3 family immunity protein [Paenibacillus algorifonticola]|uniref:Imm3 family immunity protein n=1 Tax=Paenibacillus algorifonticola TaxID=684063 RepID=UPI003D2AED3D